MMAATQQSAEGLATRADLLEALAGLRKEIARLDKGLSDLKTEIRASENRQLWHAIVIMVAMTAIFSYISKGF